MFQTMRQHKVYCWAGRYYLPVNIPFGMVASPAKLAEARALKEELQTALTNATTAAPMEKLEAEILLVLLTQLVRWWEGTPTFTDVNP